MAKNKKSTGCSAVEQQYRDLMRRCKANLEHADRELPPARENFKETLAARGLSRRDFLKWTSLTTTALLLPPMFRPMVAKAAENFSRLPVVWLHFAECTGCSEALLRASYPNVDSILLETISLEYHETLMVCAGHQAEQCLEKAMHDFAGKFICVIEGALPTGLNGRYLTLGPKAKTGLEMAREVTAKAAATICIGSCSSFGNVQAAKPNPTDALGISDALGIKTVNIAGCPPNPANFVGTLLHFLLFGALPPLDALGRPLWAYGKRIHDFCERRPHYDAGEYVEEWGDEAAKKGWCLYKVGCKGPYTFANCSKVRYNDGISWPVMAGHGCIGCTEPAFWDSMAPLEKPVAEKTVLGEHTLDKIALGLVGVTAAGIAAHAIASAVKGQKPDYSDKK
ncbi:MAG: hydrogenase small subunit [Desulfobacterota bacterium]|nr:hydrogenase small subunit [Thermodesulfobacteriota bacterium]